MKSFLFLPAAFLLSVLPSQALQTSAASTTVRTGCTNPAPPGSLVALPSSPVIYVPDGGDVVVMELESLPATSNWVEESILTGFGGDSYFRWNGPNLFSTPGVGILNYTFEIKTADTYLIRVHVRTDDPDPSEENDCWARLAGDPWEKLFFNIGSVGIGNWSYNPRYESTSDFPQYDLTPGTYTFQISGRSNNFKLDRIHVLPRTTWFAQLSDPQSDVQRDRPVTGASIRMAIDDPTNVGGLTPGLAQSALYIGFPGPNYPCGTPISIGELFIRMPTGVNRVAGFQRWQGPGQANVRNVAVPNDASLVGMTFVAQGILFEAGNYVLTDALELQVGDF